MLLSRLRPFVLLASLSGLAGCWVTNTQTATAGYARQVATATMRVAQMEERLEKTEANLRDLEGRVLAQGRDGIGAVEQLDQMQSEIGRLRGEFEVVNFQLSEMKQNFDVLMMDREVRQLHAELRLKQIEAFLGVRPPAAPSKEAVAKARTSDPKDTVPGVNEPESSEEESAGDSEKENAADQGPTDKIKKALKHIDNGRYRVARALLEKLIRDFPDDDRQPKYRFHLAESYLKEGNSAKAVGEFQKVIDGYPASDWAAWSMVRQGDSFAAMEQGENAVLFYEEVLRMFPDSEAADEARRLRRDMVQ